MAVTCIFRLIQLHRPPSTQASVSRSNAVLGATRSNVLERSAAQHGAGKALRHQRRGCAVLRRSAAGALGTSDRASRAAVQVPLGRLALASFGNPFFFGLLCGSSDANQRRNPVVDGAVPGAVPVGLAVRKYGQARRPLSFRKGQCVSDPCAKLTVRGSARAARRAPQRTAPAAGPTPQRARRTAAGPAAWRAARTGPARRADHTAPRAQRTAPRAGRRSGAPAGGAERTAAPPLTAARSVPLRRAARPRRTR